MAGIRRTWDKEYYEQRAKDRAEFGDDYVDNPTSNGDKLKSFMRKEFQDAETNDSELQPTSKAFIQARDYKLDLENKAGKVEIINPLAEESAKAGFWCEVCKCLSKDSASYLDHLNSKRHQAALGHSMRVERAGLDSVKERLEALKRKAGSSSTSSGPPKLTVEQTKEQIEKEEQERQDFKRRRKEEKKKQKSEKKQTISNPWSEEEEYDSYGDSRVQDQEQNHSEVETVQSKEQAVIEEDDEEEDNLEKILGFKGFGSSKK